MPSAYAMLITLSEAERATLEGWVRRRRTAQTLALRARIVLACAAPGAKNRHIARALGLGRLTVAAWRRRCPTRADGLLDAPRPGAPFANLSGDPAQDLHKAGFREDSRPARVGDAITEIDSVSNTSVSQTEFSELMRRADGTPVHFEVVRKGTSRTVVLTLNELLP